MRCRSTLRRRLSAVGYMHSPPCAVDGPDGERWILRSLLPPVCMEFRC
jgi:hypothetical protein